MTAVIIIAAVGGLIAWGIVASKRTSETKKVAMADLKVQKEQVEPFDIHALVSAEIADLGLREIDGAAGIPASDLLKTWKEGTETVDGCPSRDLLSFTVTPGLDPSEALDTDVSLICTADAMAASEPQADEQPGSTTDEHESA